jgi:hypothetical protein
MCKARHICAKSSDHEIIRVLLGHTPRHLRLRSSAEAQPHGLMPGTHRGNHLRMEFGWTPPPSPPTGAATKTKRCAALTISIAGAYWWTTTPILPWRVADRVSSCIWRGPGQPTVGCTAMPQADLELLLGWLDPKRKPLLVQLPAAQYQKLRHRWNLPRMER